MSVELEWVLQHWKETVSALTLAISLVGGAIYWVKKYRKLSSYPALAEQHQRICSELAKQHSLLAELRAILDSHKGEWTRTRSEDVGRLASFEQKVDRQSERLHRLEGRIEERMMRDCG